MVLVTHPQPASDPPNQHGPSVAHHPFGCPATTLTPCNGASDTPPASQQATYPAARQAGHLQTQPLQHLAMVLVTPPQDRHGSLAPRNGASASDTSSLPATHRTSTALWSPSTHPAAQQCTDTGVFLLRGLRRMPAMHRHRPRKTYIQPSAMW